MDVVLLRKLARKSVLDFGKYQGQTVQQVLDLHHTRVLRWYYYNLSKISFIPEILREIGIEEKDEISKPGTDPEKCKEVDEEMDKRNKRFCKMAFVKGDKKAIGEICHNKSRMKKDSECSLIRSEISDKSIFSKSRLQAKNHGHNIRRD